ncbi:unnamed protein product [Adineta steineri]|uniref:Uncharacterized protein n=1 Tax=Adineta steineri TaxID=433720 RepID=A0A819ANS3_9BILA|nr:unnamed protein product [Adineta steineri]CAF3780241.1 unnamed protein product [Adineta steineri]
MLVEVLHSDIRIINNRQFSPSSDSAPRSIKYLPGQAASLSLHHLNAGSVTPTPSPVLSMNPQLLTVSLTPTNSYDNVL